MRCARYDSFRRLHRAALALSSCTGGGSSVDSGGAVYAGAGAGSGSGSSASGSSPAASEIASLANSGEIERLVNLITDSSGGGESSLTSTVSFRASDIGLPDGGSGKLGLTVNGTETAYTASASSDGYVSFAIPYVPVGSAVTVKMDVRDASGSLVLTGGGSKTVTEGDSSLALVLSDKVDVAVASDSGHGLCAEAVA